MGPKVALVVGAGSPLGQQLARGLANASLRVALNDLLPNHIETLALELNAAGGQAAAYPADLSRKLGLQTMLQGLLELWEQIDVLVFIPRVQPATSLLDLDEWDWHRALDLDLTAAFLCMQSVGRIMRQLGSGTIINVLPASQAVSPVYAAAAAALAALSKESAAEFVPHNVRVHALSAEHADTQNILKLCLQDRSPVSSLEC
ncbi:MAG: SDR family NAD(P)-dependent oxidoreductase [Anaerolineales bacterium]